MPTWCCVQVIEVQNGFAVPFRNTEIKEKAYRVSEIAQVISSKIFIIATNSKAAAWNPRKLQKQLLHMVLPTQRHFVKYDQLKPELSQYDDERNLIIKETDAPSEKKNDFYKSIKV